MVYFIFKKNTIYQYVTIVWTSDRDFLIL